MWLASLWGWYMGSVQLRIDLRGVHSELRLAALLVSAATTTAAAAAVARRRGSLRRHTLFSGRLYRGRRRSQSSPRGCRCRCRRSLPIVIRNFSPLLFSVTPVHLVVSGQSCCLHPKPTSESQRRNCHCDMLVSLANYYGKNRRIRPTWPALPLIRLHLSISHNQLYFVDIMMNVTLSEIELA